MRSIGTSRVFIKLLVVLLPVFLVASAAGLSVISTVFNQNHHNALTMRVGSAAARAVSALTRLGPTAPPGQMTAILDMLRTDRAVLCAEIVDRNGIAAAAPTPRGCQRSKDAQVFSLALKSRVDGHLDVIYSLRELNQAQTALRTFMLLAIAFAGLAVAAATWLAFRVIVGRPLRNLQAAIRTTEQTGVATRALSPPRDELGTVMHAFNVMQGKLAEQSARNLSALHQLHHIYNDTPALLFSMDSHGTILSASGHLLQTCGVTRDEIVGAPFERLLQIDEKNRQASTLRVLTTHQLNDEPLRLKRSSGPPIDVLLSTVCDTSSGSETWLCVMSDVSSLRDAERELRRQALTDPLTGLPNRQGLFHHLANDGKPKTGEFGGASALLFIDLDQFKAVNDTHGHDAGDMLLKAAVARIRNCIEGDDLLARLGGDEFALVLHRLSRLENAHKVAERILDVLSVPFDLGGRQGQVSASIGIADVGEATTPEDALRLADLAMYKSKQAGRNRASFYTADLTLQVARRDNMVTKIRTGLAKGHFRLFFQPIVALETLQPAGAEALLRLQCPDEAIIPPGDVIKVAEDAGLISQLGAWVVDEGLAICRGNGNLFQPQQRRLAINLSARQIDSHFISGLVERLMKDPVLARTLTFEITETALMRSDEAVPHLLAMLRATGALIALDDFGTGYSSLCHIQRFPVDVLKIDRSFVAQLSGTNDDIQRRSRALVKAKVALAQELGMRVVAEGIETLESLEILRSKGVGFGQGFLFAPAMPFTAFKTWVEKFGGQAALPARRAVG